MSRIAGQEPVLTNAARAEKRTFSRLHAGAAIPWCWSVFGAETVVIFTTGGENLADAAGRDEHCSRFAPKYSMKLLGAWRSS